MRIFAKNLRFFIGIAKIRFSTFFHGFMIKISFFLRFFDPKSTFFLRFLGQSTLCRFFLRYFDFLNIQTLR